MAFNWSDFPWEIVVPDCPNCGGRYGVYIFGNADPDGDGAFSVLCVDCDFALVKFKRNRRVRPAWVHQGDEEYKDGREQPIPPLQLEP